MSDAPIELHYDRGSLVVPRLPESELPLRALLVEDARAGVWRASAERYREIALSLHRRGVAWVDHAKGFEALPLRLVKPIRPFPHQTAGLEAWRAAGRRGIVELPTGAGKTILAVLAIAEVQRPTLVVVPTIGLLEQWRRVLAEHLGEAIGVVGGGAKDRQPITVTTYDSAAFHTEFWGRDFGLLVCDECHHLPAPAYRFIASGAIAPFRLGLSATLERADGGERICEALLGPRCHSVAIEALEGDFLAPYDVEHVEVELDEDEQARYDAARARYLDFLRGSGVSIRRDGWSRFVAVCQRSEEGRLALAAYREQRRVAFSSRAKLGALWQVLVRHRNDRAIVFTEDNETVYRLSERLLIPVITHHTKAPERRRLLDAFAEGRLSALLTSKVLNEGVDVPEANVGVVLSGSGSVREHVQRLGRILRKRPDKRAVLYEITTNVSAEAGVRERRRQHAAYLSRDPEPIAARDAAERVAEHAAEGDAPADPAAPAEGGAAVGAPSDPEAAPC